METFHLWRHSIGLFTPQLALFCRIRGALLPEEPHAPQARESACLNCVHDTLKCALNTLKCAHYTPQPRGSTGLRGVLSGSSSYSI